MQGLTLKEKRLGCREGRVLEKDRHATTKPKRRGARRTRRPALNTDGLSALHEKNRHSPDAYSPHPVQEMCACSVRSRRSEIDFRAKVEVRRQQATKRR